MDIKVATNFLSQHLPIGPWVLTAISVDKKNLDTKTFNQDSVKELGTWLEKNKEKNIYFSVNPTTKFLVRKASRKDIRGLLGFHVDVDPRSRSDLKEEQERILNLLTKKLPKGVPAPTWVIFSGGGYQAFWRLNEELPIDGKEEVYEELKRYNQQLEMVFGADSCHNIDRILRLPGTINHPDARKKKKGRTKVEAKLVSYVSENVYSITDFIKINVLQTPGMGERPEGKITVSSEIEYFDDINFLDEWEVPDRLKVIAVQGEHPDELKIEDNSRSGWLFDLTCNLARSGVPDEVIYSVITNPNFAISESVLEFGSSAKKYALRQIQRAREMATNPVLCELNDKHAIIENLGGKCLVIEEVLDPTLNRYQLTKQSFETLRNRYMHRMVIVGKNKEGAPVTKPAGKFWLEHPQRRQYHTLVFSPGRDIEGAYNMWRGFSVEAQEGDCSLYKQHVRENICGGNEEYYQYLLSWMARAVQQPGNQGEVAVVLRGDRGVGKGIFTRIFGNLFGRHFMQVSNPSHLVGKFNAHLRDISVLFADEAFFAGDKKHESILKTLITEATLTIESKGIDVETVPNYVHLIMASNDRHVVPAGSDERRYFVLDVGEGNKQDTSFFRKLIKQMENGGSAALLWELLKIDLSGFQVRSVPQTQALREQKLFSLDTPHEWFYQKLQRGTVFEEDTTWETEIAFPELVNDYLSYLKRFDPMSRRANETKLGMFLSSLFPTLKKGRYQSKPCKVMDEYGTIAVSIRSVNIYTFPKLKSARKSWEDQFGETTWDEATIDTKPENNGVHF